MAYAIYKLPTGYYKMTYQGDFLTGLEGCKGPEEGGEKTPLTQEAFRQLMDYFKGQRRTFSLPLKMEGTPFQREVWEALLKIPYGQTWSYKDLAQAVGRPRAYRAVGGANNKNPIAIIVPCHRVIGADGSLVGYGDGLETKAYLLDLEGAAYKKK
ncbi:MAG: methylated-DNA--[protein]-cysteine S-methyltransferase [Tissierellia bacterium]|nr:methylated-DNA--[protein]-cysteine S-methyltransferase [Tissierellia bacterium]